MYNKRLYTFAISLGLLICQQVPMIQAQEAEDVSWAWPDYSFLCFERNPNDTGGTQLSDSLFDAHACGIRFQVNRTELLPSDPFIALYDKALAPLLKSRDMILSRIYVRGAASPEGPYENNQRLGRERTQRLVEFISSRLGQSLDEGMIQAESITEDYGYLVSLLRRANDPDLEAVEAVWQASAGDERYCKQHLMAAQNGRLWQRLKHRYFPQLRQARVVLCFAAKHAVDRMEEEPIPLMGVERPLVHESGYQPLPLLPKPERQRMLAVRTNLLHDFLVMPKIGWVPSANLQLEYFPSDGHFTYNMGFTFSNHRHWKDKQFFQVRQLQLELRRYFKGDAQFVGPFLYATAEGAIYGIGLTKGKGNEGEGGGAGIGAGYSLPLNRKGSLRLEFTADLGFFITRYDPYVYGNPLTGNSVDDKYYYDYTGHPSQFKKRNHRFTWMGPTNVGIHITYDILYRKKTKGGRR